MSELEMSELEMSELEMSEMELSELEMSKLEMFFSAENRISVTRVLLGYLILLAGLDV